MLSEENSNNSSNFDESQSDGNSNETPIVDMLLSKKDIKVVDSETLITDIQKRVWGALKKGYEYSAPFDESEIYLRSNVFSKIDMAILYIDLVGSTTMALELPEEKVATIISSFAQEMAYVVKQYGGFILKFVGDAVLAFFIGEKNALKASDNIVECAKSMISAIEKGINPILNQYDYPDLKVKIGIDYGKAMVIRYGADEKRAPVDLIGPVLNIAAKIQNHAKPNQILIGNDIFTKLHPTTQKTFKEIVWQNDEWRYRSRISGEIYKVYEFRG